MELISANFCQKVLVSVRGVVTIEATKAAASVNEDTEFGLKLQKIETL